MHSGHRHASGQLNLFEAEPLPSQAAQFGHHVIGQRWATGRLAAAGLPGLDTLGEAHALLLGNGGQKADDSVTEEASTVEVLLGERLELHARGREPL